MLLLVFLYPFGVQLNVVQNATVPAPQLSCCAPNFLERRKAKVRLPRIHGGRRQPATQSRLRTAVEVLKALDTVFIIEAESDY
jgi:hypothetical protein